LSAAGDIDADNKLESAVAQDAEKSIYRKLVIRDSVLAGVILFGDIRGSNEIQNAISAGKDISPYRADLGKADFDFTLLK